MAVVNPALGTILKATIGSSLTALAQVLSIDGPSMEQGTRETTHLGTVSWKTFAGTISDGGEISATILFDPADSTHAAMITAITTTVAFVWNLIFADTGAGTFSFSGILTKFATTGMEVEANLEAQITIKITGAVTFTP
jgi:hypothetical protein